MNIQQLLRIGAQAFQSNTGSSGGGLSIDRIVQALSALLPGEGNKVDLPALISQMQGGGLAAIAQSWLGDGGNAGIDAGSILEIFGRGKVDQFADQLGLDSGTAVEGLRAALPEIVDKASSGGALASLGGIGGLADMAGKLFGR
ncbi:MAG: hypothetical protein CVV18_00630 [Gammaproteobacteria bacterium HGW-Gammaproteobacteria-8]|nr:MAG: hypothetical protein CVV18_00630 [Gammaproteobacteria bacterium HGW-Gammaproteobacteria-8]